MILKATRAGESCFLGQITVVAPTDRPWESMVLGNLSSDLEIRMWPMASHELDGAENGQALLGTLLLSLDARSHARRGIRNPNLPQSG